ncbi:MAG: hypothetical protein WBS33_18695 [Verrucomicrobiia bacterium]
MLESLWRGAGSNPVAPTIFFFLPGANDSQGCSPLETGENYIPCAKGNRIRGGVEHRVFFYFLSNPLQTRRLFDFNPGFFPAGIAVAKRA